MLRGLAHHQRLGRNPTNFKFEDLVGFSDDCLTCKVEDHTLNTIIFNTFIYCQIFNEYTARNLFDTVNPFEGLMNNYVFLAVSVITVLVQTFLVYVGGEFVKVSPISANQYFICVGLGSIGLVVGALMRFIPVEEAEEDFFKSSWDSGAAKKTVNADKNEDRAPKEVEMA